MRQGTPLLPQQQGGAQERQRRAGTESVALAVGLARALALVAEDRDAENARQAALRDRLIGGLLALPDVGAHRPPR